LPFHIDDDDDELARFSSQKQQNPQVLWFLPLINNTTALGGIWVKMGFVKNYGEMFPLNFFSVVKYSCGY
jgi:hypothetical protein